jgi:hypothetical protein
MNVLPWWMQWVQAIALIIISVLGSWIAYKQVKIASAKLNLDLYDRRFAVFQAVREYLVDVVFGDLSQTSSNKFHLGTADAVFLFDERIALYIEDIGKRIASFRVLNDRLANVGDDDSRRTDLADQCADQLTALQNELAILVDQFKPFLKLGNI